MSVETLLIAASAVMSVIAAALILAHLMGRDDE